MDESKVLLRELAWRGLIALPLFVIAWILLQRAEGGFQSSALLFFGMALMVLSAIVVGPTLARILSQPAGNLYYPSARFDRPQPIYSIPAGHRVSGEFEEAFEGFREISRQHPQLLRPYGEMMDIAIADLKDWPLANEVYREARSQIRDRADRDRLERMRAFLVS